VHPSPTGAQVSDQPRLRKRVASLRARVEQLDGRLARLSRRVEHHRRIREARARLAGRDRIEARKRARERAEGVLGGQISLMLPLAKERAELRWRSDTPRGFRRPAKGHISQGYGCQRAYRYGHDGSTCARFHDGIDIAAARGARVRAAADGYVAYVGWNPWDHGRRSFVVLIGHARGFETIYAHLRPVRKVAAGQRVRRGEVIGIVGVTGHTTGPHVHWEVSRDFRTLDPRRAGR
jgi:murein DD-endopeptidase MepM/ murein hydrolase activator NlpD